MGDEFGTTVATIRFESNGRGLPVVGNATL
jgi:hypothetical protein